jgi:hypothetical protein
MGALAQPQAAKGSIAAVTGFYGGTEVRFAHTEASSAKVAKLLTRMTGSPVLLVPRLAAVPRAALANVFVFANGVKGGGPMGFQPDVFDSAPGTPGYSPLRALNLVRWAKDAKPRELRSVTEVRTAAARRALAIRQPGVVVNMPFLRWPGGSR